MEEEKQNTHNFSAYIERQQTYKYVEKKAAKSICIFAASQIWSLREWIRDVKKKTFIGECILIVRLQITRATIKNNEKISAKSKIVIVV